MAHEDRKNAKNDIMDAAIKEFAQNGFNGTSLGAISRRAGQNQALIHYYFDNKEKLYTEVLKKLFSIDQKQEIPIYPGKWDLTPSQKLYVSIYFIVNIHIEATDPEVYRIFMWELAEGRRFLDPMIKKYILPRQKILSDIVAEGISNGEFVPINPDLVVFWITSFITSYNMHKEAYKSSGLYGKLYGKNGTDEILKFLLESVFKVLSPGKKEISLPEFPADLKDMIDTLLSRIKSEKDGGLTEEIVVNLNNILSG